MPWQDAPEVESPSWQDAPLVNPPKDSGISSIGRSFNKGLVDFLMLPTDLFNIARELPGTKAFGEARPEVLGQGAPLPGADQFRQAVANTGLTAQPGQEAEGFIARSAEILGSSVIPAGAMLNRGRQVLAAAIPEGKRTVMQQMTAQAARSPGITVAGDVAGSFGAGAGGEIVNEFTDDPVLISLGELAGGFVPGVVAAGVMSGPARLAKDAVSKHIIPFTEAGAMPRAAARLQALSADPEAAARRIVETEFMEGVSPARRTGERRLLELERRILEDDPALDKKFSEDLAQASANTRAQATQFDGDPNRARALLRQGRDYLVNLVNVRAAKAANDAAEAVAALGSEATPRQTSRVARARIEEAYTAARADETRLWEEIDRTVPANFSNARQRLSDEVSRRSEFADPEDIPQWLAAALTKDGEFTFDDVHTIRQRVRKTIQRERAEEAPDRNKIRILTNIEEGLLDDMAATNAEGSDAARAFSLALNEKFTRGAVGRLLGNERSGGASVAPEDTLTRLLQGSASATQIDQFLRAAPNARPELEQFIKSSFLLQAVDENTVKPAVANRFIGRMRRSGVFEIFPELENELRSVTGLVQGAQRLGVRARSIRSLVHNAKKSRVALYLDAPPGEEMDALLRARNPRAVASSLVRRMKGDRTALQGLKTAFVETLMRNATRTTQTGETQVSGARFSKLLNEYQGAAASLGMTDVEMARLSRIAHAMRVIEEPVVAATGNVIEDKPSAIVDFVARIAGAQYGGELVGGSIGSSLVAAQAGSKRVVNFVRRLTTKRATEILIAAHQDPELYRALLTRTTDPPARQDKAAEVLNTWLVGEAVQKIEED